MRSSVRPRSALFRQVPPNHACHKQLRTLLAGRPYSGQNTRIDGIDTTITRISNGSPMRQ